jgi:hypothetical protein
MIEMIAGMKFAHEMGWIAASNAEATAAPRQGSL